MNLCHLCPPLPRVSLKAPKPCFLFSGLTIIRGISQEGSSPPDSCLRPGQHPLGTQPGLRGITAEAPVKPDAMSMATVGWCPPRPAQKGGQLPFRTPSPISAWPGSRQSSSPRTEATVTLSLSATDSGPCPVHQTRWAHTVMEAMAPNRFEQGLGQCLLRGSSEPGFSHTELFSPPLS